MEKRNFGASEGEKTILVGYGREDVTPDYPVSLAGSAASRVSEGSMDPIYFTCIALRQGENTFLLATMDFVCTYEEFADPLRAHLSEVSGIPEERILLNSTHTHSSVSARYESGTGIPAYRADLAKGAAAAVLAALEDLSPAEAWYGSVQTEGMVWVRHYKMADGTYAGANYGSFQSGIVGHACEADREMQLIRFSREEKKDVVLMNFPSHATLNQKSVLLSADFPGPAREYVAEKTDSLVAYFIAGGGDQVPNSRVKEECFSNDYRVYGEEVGRLAVEGLQKLTRAEAGEISLSHRRFLGKSNKTGLERAEEALQVKAIWDQVGGRGTEKGRAAAKEHGFSSVYQVTAILNRMKFEEELPLDMKVLSLGEMSLIFAPYEMFGSTSMKIKGDSPYPMTFLVSCAQNHVGYLPDEMGWRIGCYEAQITRFAPGTAERLGEEYVSMLREMKEEHA